MPKLNETQKTLNAQKELRQLLEKARGLELEAAKRAYLDIFFRAQRASVAPSYITTAKRALFSALNDCDIMGSGAKNRLIDYWIRQAQQTKDVASDTASSNDVENDSTMPWVGRVAAELQEKENNPNNLDAIIRTCWKR